MGWLTRTKKGRRKTSESKRSGGRGRSSSSDERQEILRLIGQLRHENGDAAMALVPLTDRSDRRGATRPSAAEGRSRPRALPAALDEPRSRPSPSRAGRPRLEAESTLFRGEPDALEARLDGLVERVVPMVRRMQAQADQIEQAIAKGGPRAMAGDLLSGRVDQSLMPDILQMVSSNQLSGVFEVELEDQKATLFFQDGQVVHGITGPHSGEEAFYAAFLMADGRFRFKGTTEAPPEHTIQANTQFLILEALRRIDEQSGG